MQRRESEENTFAKVTGISANANLENKFQYRRHGKQGWEENSVSWNREYLHEASS